MSDYLRRFKYGGPSNARRDRLQEKGQSSRIVIAEISTSGEIPIGNGPQISTYEGVRSECGSTFKYTVLEVDSCGIW